ncbi:MAG: VIT and VWA domain-containing protein [Sulfuritalea sp.]|nr:VIT and VWA domain-containing protein [Sulfuritalea sp.]MDP1981713.1 VIT and VWA domain-containing protein [Sulfuritalea sp.]
MIWFRKLTAALLAVSSLGSAQPVLADESAADDKTLAPYFFVDNGDPAIDRLPLKATDVAVKIAGVIADVTVTQHYKNEGTRPIEARYVFPASTRAAVYGMRMQVGNRQIDAKIREKKQARAEYDAARKEGKSASLLEQQRPNVFQMNVANILPGDDISVELHYTETLVPSEGKYQFMFPTVVGPRYNGSPAKGSGVKEQWVAQPTQRSGEVAKSTFGMKLSIDSPIAVKEFSSSSHKVQFEQKDGRHISMLLPASAEHGNRDFILDYRLAGNTIESGVLLSQGSDENFFLALIEPPAHIANSEIVPREYIFIVDISGSMHGFPLETAKGLLRNLVGSLKPTDTFNVMLFAGDNSVLAPQSMPATKANIEAAIGVINRQRGGGGTELLPAMRRALALSRDDSRARSFVVVTDGYVTVEKDAFELVRGNLNKANVFSFGIGASVNRHLMEGLARAGQGEAFIVTNSSQADSEALRFRRYVESPVWTHLKVKIDGLDAYDLEPATLPDLFGSRPVVLMGKWRGEAKGSITVEGHAGNGLVKRTVNIGADRLGGDTPALRYLWARSRIGALADTTKLDGGGNESQVATITGLGLKYNLLTDYTSFIAIDHVVRNRQGSDTVDQPLPMPQGVSDLAVGGEVPSTPEPEFYALIALAGGLGAWLRRKSKRHEQSRVQ